MSEPKKIKGESLESLINELQNTQGPGENFGVFNIGIPKLPNKEDIPVELLTEVKEIMQRQEELMNRYGHELIDSAILIVLDELDNLANKKND